MEIKTVYGKTMSPILLIHLLVFVIILEIESIEAKFVDTNRRSASDNDVEEESNRGRINLSIPGDSTKSNHKQSL